MSGGDIVKFADRLFHLSDLLRHIVQQDTFRCLRWNDDLPLHGPRKALRHIARQAYDGEHDSLPTVSCSD
jgi:hypothetical protein